MAYDVNFQKGLQAAFDALETKDAGTLYFVTDTPAIYLGSQKITSGADLTAALTRLGAAETDIAAVKLALTGIDLTTSGSVKTAIGNLETTLGNKIGTLSTLKTSAKTSLVGAMNELYDSIAAGGTASVLTLTKETTATKGYAHTYTLTQGTNTIGKIDIPKDLVVTGGEVVTATAEAPVNGATSGEFIKLNIANQEEPLYINAAKLVDIYTAQKNAAQVQLAVVGGEISATIVAGSIGTAELAADSVTTVKIVDSNVTTAKIADGAITNDKLDADTKQAVAKAKTAVQSVAASTENGYISVDGSNVPVHGLDTAAYTKASDYDPAGAATTVQTNLVGKETDAAGALTMNGLKKNDDALDTRLSAVETAMGEGGSVTTQIQTEIDKLDVSDTAVAGKYVSQVSETDGKITVVRADLPDYSNTYEAKGASDAALNAAKTYTDTALTWGTF